MASIIVQSAPAEEGIDMIVEAMLKLHYAQDVEDNHSIATEIASGLRLLREAGLNVRQLSFGKATPKA